MAFVSSGQRHALCSRPFGQDIRSPNANYSHQGRRGPAGSRLASPKITTEAPDPEEFDNVEAGAKWNAGATLSLHGSAPRDEPCEPVGDVCHLRHGRDVENHCDECYYPDAHDNNTITPGSPLAVRVGVTANFQSGSSREA
jgi:hypothetical protein